MPQKVTKLGLHLPSDPRWVNMAEMQLEDILTDHAFCEQKAATSCISLVQQYAHLDKLVREIAPIVTEEWGHFRQVLTELDKRGLKLGPQRKDLYVNELRKFMRKGGSKQDRLVDQLLICAMIEARSAERFRLLSIHINDDQLKTFYHKFMVSEAGHYKLFLQLAKEYGASEEGVMDRWQECLAFEAGILADMTPRGDRMH